MRERPHFYLFGDAFRRGDFRGDFSHPRELAGLIRGDTSPSTLPEKPIIRWSMGKAAPDEIVWTTSPGGWFASNVVIGHCREAGLTGLETYPVVVVDRSGVERHDYSGVVVRGRCGPVSYDQAELFMKERPGGRFPFVRGCTFALDNWDGSDFFMELPGPSGRRSSAQYLTERARALFARLEIRNVVLTPISDLELSVAELRLAQPDRMTEALEHRIRLLVTAPPTP